LSDYVLETLAENLDSWNEVCPFCGNRTLLFKYFWYDGNYNIIYKCARCGYVNIGKPVKVPAVNITTLTTYSYEESLPYILILPNTIEKKRFPYIGRKFWFGKTEEKITAEDLEKVKQKQYQCKCGHNYEFASVWPIIRRLKNGSVEYRIDITLRCPICLNTMVFGVHITPEEYYNLEEELNIVTRDRKRYLLGKAVMATSDKSAQFYIRSATLSELKQFLRTRFTSGIGHESTAKFISELTGVEVPVNRTFIDMNVGDEAMVLQFLKRPPEGKKYSEKDLIQLLKEGYIEIRYMLRVD